MIARNEEYFSFVMLLYIYIYFISAILRGLCTKNKRVGDAYKKRTHVIVKVSGKILGRISR